MAITWTKDGPTGSEDPEFTGDGGVRIALVGEDGSLEDYDHWDLEYFGGVLPITGDRIATLWHRGDPNNEESWRVLARYYVGEFAGDNCWWLVVAPEPLSARDKQLFRLARAASKETRRIAKAREAHKAKRLTEILDFSEPATKGKLHSERKARK